MANQCCRVCRTPLKHTFVDLGMSPLANSYVASNRAYEGDKFYPLHAFVCDQCFLVQLEEFETPEAIFSNYAYFSSYSQSWLRHAEEYTSAMIRRFGLVSSSKAVEVASNDGYLLQFFLRDGIQVLGVEPAANVAEVARAKGINCETVFFGESTATRLKEQGHLADLMIANNVLAHVPDILDFVGGFRVLLKPEGVATFEFPHLLRQIQGTQFDQVYHEHFSYLSLLSVSEVARRAGLRVFDVEQVPTHGGSLRVFVAHPQSHHAETHSVAKVLDDEKAANLDKIDGYRGFGARALEIKLSALEFLIGAKHAGKRICAYGAAAKGNTFLNYVGVGRQIIDLVADRSPHKQGTLLPGSRILVGSPADLIAARPHYVLILPWNLRREISEEMAEIREWGGRFVTAIPTIDVF